MDHATLTRLENELNEAILTGRAMEAFEQYYADGIVMQENTNEPTQGKDANRKREEEFFAAVEEFHGAELLGSAVGDGVTYSEWVYDITFKEGGRVKMTQVAARRWKDGKVVHERFYGPDH